MFIVFLSAIFDTKFLHLYTTQGTHVVTHPTSHEDCTNIKNANDAKPAGIYFCHINTTTMVTTSVPFLRIGWAFKTLPDNLSELARLKQL